MNSKIIGVVIVVAIAVGAGWWATHPSAPAPTPVAAVPKTPAPASPAPRPPVPSDQSRPRVELPVAPPAPVQPTPTPAPTDKPAADPHTDLNNAIQDIAKRIRAGDIVALMEEYMPPEQLAKMPPEERARMEQEMQRPESKQMFEVMAQAFDAMKDQTPEMNAAGDEATYMMIPPPGLAPADAQPEPFHFKKINGRWYVNEH